MFGWAKFILFSAGAIFFLEFGIEEMIRAYRLKNPVEFLASFFSASFIILISGALLAGFIWRMVMKIRGEEGKRRKGEEEDLIN
jgi:hypothetical protein